MDKEIVFANTITRGNRTYSFKIFDNAEKLSSRIWKIPDNILVFSQEEEKSFIENCEEENPIEKYIQIGMNFIDNDY